MGGFLYFEVMAGSSKLVNGSEGMLGDAKRCGLMFIVPFISN